MSLIERDEQIAALRDAFDSCADGRGRFVVVSGQGGTGKTALLNWLAEHARSEQALVLTATAARAQRSISLGVLDHLRYSAGLSDLAPGTPPGGATQDPGAWLRVVQNLAGELLDLAGDQRLVITIDDAQFIDAPSLQVLLQLRRRLDTRSVLVVLGERDHPCGHRAELHAALAEITHVRRIRLNPLTPCGSARLLGELLGTAAGAELVSTATDVCGSNLFLLHAFAEDHRAGDGPPGDAYRRSVLSCLHRWDPTMLALARGVAVLERSATPALLARLLDLPVRDAERLLTALGGVGVFAGSSRFRHATVQAAVLDDLSRAEESRIRHRCAALLHEDGAPSTMIARHLVVTGTTPAEPWAARALLAAAKQAATRNDIDHARECFRLAHDACQDERQRAQILAMTARLAWRVNPLAAERYFSELLAAHQGGLLAIEDAVVLIKLLLWHGRTEEALDALAALETNSGGIDEDCRAELERQLDAVNTYLQYSEPPRLDRPAGDVEVQRLGNGGIDWARMLDLGPQPEDLLAAEAILEGCRLNETPLDSVVSALLVLICAGKIDSASHWCERLISLAENQNSPTWVAFVSDFRAHIALRRGDLPAAELHARIALTSIDPQSWGVAIGSPLGGLMAATTAMGRLEVTAQHLDHVLPDAIRHTWFWPQFLNSRGLYYLATDRPRAARDDFLAAGEVLGRLGLDCPAFVPWRSNAGWALLALGRPDEALRLTDEQLGRPSASITRTRGLTLRAKAAADDPRERLATLREASELLKQSGDRYELSLVLADLSTAYHLIGEFNRAQMIANHAMSLAESCQSTSTCQRLLPASMVPAQRTKPGEEDADDVKPLSEAELRVAALAAIGHTNREISRRLHITVSTVEQHITRIYRKLNVNRRADLVAHLPADVVVSAPVTDDGRPGRPR